MKKAVGTVWVAFALLAAGIAGCAQQTSAGEAAPSPLRSAAVSGPAATSSPSPDSAPTRPPGDPPAITTVGAFFALTVPDIESSAAWYAETLGLKVIMQPPKTDQTAVAVLEGGGLIVELIQHDKAQPLDALVPPGTDPSLIHGIAKVGIVVEDFDATVALLKARNVAIAYGPFSATAEQRANLIIRDNAGNMIQFFGK